MAWAEAREGERGRGGGKGVCGLALERYVLAYNIITFTTEINQLSKYLHTPPPSLLSPIIRIILNLLFQFVSILSKKYHCRLVIVLERIDTKRKSKLASTYISGLKGGGRITLEISQHTYKLTQLWWWDTCDSSVKQPISKRIHTNWIHACMLPA